MAKIKICGLTRPEDIQAVNEARPDYAGFVFAPGKRTVTVQTARLLKELLSPDIRSVGVFVNAPENMIIELARSGTINLIQLHGDEPPDVIRNLKFQTGLPIIKVLRFRKPSEIQDADTLPCDYLLLDTYVKDQYGGSGLSFDWSQIPTISKPWFLAGGINVSNVKEALSTNAWCLDISSGAETGGRKDPVKINKIINIIRSNEQ